LPGPRIERTEVVGKIVLEENPGAADLHPGNEPDLRAAAQLL